MTIRILCVGKIKEAFYRDAMAELIKRMGRYAAAEVIEVAEEKAPEGLSAAEKERILASEGERLLGKTDERDHVTVLFIGLFVFPILSQLLSLFLSDVDYCSMFR